MDTWQKPADGMKAIISDKKAGCRIALQLCVLQWGFLEEVRWQDGHGWIL